MFSVMCAVNWNTFDSSEMSLCRSVVDATTLDQCQMTRDFDEISSGSSVEKERQRQACAYRDGTREVT